MFKSTDKSGYFRVKLTDKSGYFRVKLTDNIGYFSVKLTDKSGYFRVKYTDSSRYPLIAVYFLILYNFFFSLRHADPPLTSKGADHRGS